jgi:HEAT repeat protein
MSKTLLIIIGIACAVITAAGIMWYHSPLNTACRQLYDEDPDVCCQAIKTLGEIGAKEFAPEIIKLLLNTNDHYVRQSAAEALRQFGNKEAIPEITKLLHSEIAYTRRSAALALMDLKAKESIPELKGLLNDEVNFVRDAAERALRKLGVPADEIREATEKK